MTKTSVLLMAGALLWTGTAAATETLNSCDAAGLEVNTEAPTLMDREALQQRIEMLEAQGRKLRGLVEQSLLPPPGAGNGENQVQQALVDEMLTTENAILCLEEVENASMEARLELLRKYLDSVRPSR